MGGAKQPNSGFPVNQNPNLANAPVTPENLSVPLFNATQNSAGISPTNPNMQGYPPYNGEQILFPDKATPAEPITNFQSQVVSGQGYPQPPAVPYADTGNSTSMPGSGVPVQPMGQGANAGQRTVPPRRYPNEPMDVRKVAQLAEEQHPDLANLRTRVPFNMPGLVPASASRSSRRKNRQASSAARSGSAAGSTSSSGFTIPGDPNAALSFKELLGQPVSNVAASTIASPKELEDSDGLQFRAVGLSVGSVPEPDIRYPIPYIAREHPSYYTGYEVSLIMESIRDSEHARQVLARIVAVPRWVRWLIALFGGLCGAAVSALNGFLSLIAFAALMAVVLIFTYSFASRIGSGRFYDPTGYKTIWLGAFMPIGLLSATIVARAVVPQPWLSMIAFTVTAFCGIFWTTWIQKFQIKRLLSSEIQDAAGD